MVRDTGSHVEITAKVRGDEVAHALEGFRGDRGFQGGEARLSWSGRSKYVRVDKVESVSTSTRSRTVRLWFDVLEPQRDHTLEMSVDGHTPADLTEFALRSALFGEKNPLESQYAGFLAEIPNPLEGLRVARMSEETIRPLTELMLVDSLVGSGRASRITELKLGVAVGGTRRLKLSWVPGSQHYVGARSGPRSVEGEVRL